MVASTATSTTRAAGSHCRSCLSVILAEEQLVERSVADFAERWRSDRCGPVNAWLTFGTICETARQCRGVPDPLLRRIHAVDE